MIDSITNFHRAVLANITDLDPDFSKTVDDNFWDLIDELDRPTDRDHESQLRIARKTGKPCSCWCCGNRRKYEGETVQERKHIDKSKEWI